MYGYIYVYVHMYKDIIWDDFKKEIIYNGMAMECQLIFGKNKKTSTFMVKWIT